jgi:pimeloyl-ACP methyl ester carboxylesterase
MTNSFSQYRIFRFCSLLLIFCMQIMIAEDRACCAPTCPKTEGFITIPARTVTPPDPSGNTFIPEAQIFYRLVGNCSGNRTTIVFLHGFGADADVWLCQQFGLCNNFCTLAYDLRGFARSSKNTNLIYNYDVWAGDLNAILNALGIVNPVIVGSSLGGAVALDFAITFPQVASKLAVVGAFPVDAASLDCAPGCPRFPQPPFDILAVPFIKAFAAADYPAFKETFTNGVYNEACQSLLVNAKAAAIQDGFPPLGIFLAGFPDPVDLTSTVSQISIPTLVMYGGIDAVVPISNSFFLRQQIANSVLVEFFDHGHFPQVTDFQRFNCVLRSFVLGILPTDCQVCPLVKPAPTPLGG